MKGNSFFSVQLISKLVVLGLLMGLLPIAASAGVFRSLGRMADKVGNVVVVGPVKGSVRARPIFPPQDGFATCQLMLPEVARISRPDAF